MRGLFSLNNRRRQTVTKPSTSGFSNNISEWPADWRLLFTRKNYNWLGGYDAVFNQIRKEQKPIDGNMALMIWHYATRLPNQDVHSDSGFSLYDNWLYRPLCETTLPGTFCSLPAAIASKCGNILRSPQQLSADDDLVTQLSKSDDRYGCLGSMMSLSTRVAIASNRWERFQEQKRHFKWLRYRSIYCDAHEIFNGLILPVDHVFWDNFIPPNSLTCSCKIEQVSENRMKKNGWSVTEDIEVPFCEVHPAFAANWAKQWPGLKRAPLLIF